MPSDIPHTHSFSTAHERWFKVGMELKMTFNFVAVDYRQNKITIDHEQYRPVLEFIRRTVSLYDVNPIIKRGLDSFSGLDLYRLFGLPDEQLWSDEAAWKKKPGSILSLPDSFVTFGDYEKQAYTDLITNPRTLQNPDQPEMALTLAERLYRQLPPFGRDLSYTDAQKEVAKLLKDGPFRFLNPILTQISSGLVSTLLGHRMGVRDTSPSVHMGLARIIESPLPRPEKSL